MMALIVSAFLALLAVFGTTIFHYESLKVVRRLSAVRHHSHFVVAMVLAWILVTHVVEVFIYAVICASAVWPLYLGSISGAELSVQTLVYFSAETYSSLGNGDLLPHGALRLITSIESLNGILLLAWSGSFLFVVTDQIDRKHKARPPKPKT